MLCLGKKIKKYPQILTNVLKRKFQCFFYLLETTFAKFLQQFFKINHYVGLHNLLTEMMFAYQKISKFGRNDVEFDV